MELNISVGAASFMDLRFSLTTADLIQPLKLPCVTTEHWLSFGEWTGGRWLPASMPRIGHALVVIRYTLSDVVLS